MNRIVDDQELINQFLEGNDCNAANPNLKIEVNADSVRLLAAWEGVIATIKRIQYTQTISLLSNSKYYELIKATLIERHFLPIQTRIHPNFEQYQRCQIPDGYKVRYTPVKLLWREWRFTWHEKSLNRLQRRILLMTNKNWYPIQTIEFHQGLLILKTLVSTTTIQPDESVIWLYQIQEMPRAKITHRENLPGDEQPLSIEDVYPKFKSANKSKQLATMLSVPMNQPIHQGI